MLLYLNLLKRLLGLLCMVIIMLIFNKICAILGFLVQVYYVLCIYLEKKVAIGTQVNQQYFCDVPIGSDPATYPSSFG